MMTPSMPRQLILGTRSSPLAVAQAEIARRAFLSAGVARVLVEKIQTTGDKRLDVQLGRGLAGTMEKGLFTRELEDALLSGRIDVAVHSLKDVPTEMPEGIRMGAVLERAPAHDVLLSKRPGGWAALPAGARIATSSERRKSQLLQARPDLLLGLIRGNVGTRLLKVHGFDEFEGLVLAAAGLVRLGLDPAAGEVCFESARFYATDLSDLVLPAPGQGAIGLQIADRAGRTNAAVDAVNHAPTWAAVTAERAVLSALGGGCHAALGVRTLVEEDSLRVHARYFPNPGAPSVEADCEGPLSNASALGRELGMKLRELAGGGNPGETPALQ
jgi:hydroxymethylbilane synthase